jgi:hypothetical protein
VAGGAHVDHRVVAECEGARIYCLQSSPIEIGGKPTLTFEVKNLREAHELCHEQWLKIDLAEAICDGVPLWDGKAKLRARMASPDESALYAEAQNSGEPADGLMLVYLVELDGEAADQESAGPGEVPPHRT